MDDIFAPHSAPSIPAKKNERVPFIPLALADFSPPKNICAHDSTHAHTHSRVRVRAYPHAHSALYY